MALALAKCSSAPLGRGDLPGGGDPPSPQPPKVVPPAHLSARGRWWLSTAMP